jgi:hypothetical protein
MKKYNTLIDTCILGVQKKASNLAIKYELRSIPLSASKHSIQCLNTIKD